MNRQIKFGIPIICFLFSAGAISGCAALESIGDFRLATEQVDEEQPSPAESQSEQVTVEAESEDEVADEGLRVPSCDDIYTSELTEKLAEELRANVGDTSEGDFGFGTTNLELVGLLIDVRDDLRVSCTWYLPASESVSVTSIAIVSGSTLTEIAEVLVSQGVKSREEGDGTLYTLDSATQDQAPDFIATEAHFLTNIVCPASLAEESCGAWIASNYALGRAEPLTIDAAINLGVMDR